MAWPALRPRTPPPIAEAPEGYEGRSCVRYGEETLRRHEPLRGAQATVATVATGGGDRISGGGGALPRGSAPPRRPAPAAEALPPTRPLASLASVLARAGEIQTICPHTDAAHSARHACQHALQQERRLGGVLPELHDAVAALHSSLQPPSHSPAAAAAKAPSSSPQPPASPRPPGPAARPYPVSAPLRVAPAAARGCADGRGARPASARSHALSGARAPARGVCSARADAQSPSAAAAVRPARGGSARGPSMLLQLHPHLRAPAPSPSTDASLVNPFHELRKVLGHAGAADGGVVVGGNQLNVKSLRGLSRWHRSSSRDVVGATASPVAACQRS